MGEQSGRAALHIPKGRFTREAGATIRLMASVYTSTQTGLAMKENGCRTYSMARARKAGLTPQSSQASTVRGARTESASTFGLMVPFTRGSGLTTRSPAMGTTSGVTGVGT